MPSSRLAVLACVLGLPAILLLAFTVYQPGLTGQFILDDIPNLQSLAGRYDYETSERLLFFVFSGHAGLSGRPLSLLSFLINDYAWPSTAYSFKYTNVLLHLLNGTLICWIGFLLTSQGRRDGQANFAISLPNLMALLATAAWLLHPLNVSTVLYVIQRMTMLAACFNLIGIVFYLKGRSLAGHKPILGYGLMSAGMIGGVGLGVLSKENAALLPLYVLVMEFTVLATPRPRRWRAWAWLFLGLPALLLVGWHIWNFSGIADSYGTRTFSMSERLLTEARVLWDYLGLILLPRASGTGIFHDDFPVSHDWLAPPTTLLAVAGLILLIAVAIRYRHRQPWLAFGILWFLAGHLLESGIVALEIYFEHRNYLPMIGPIMALAHYVTTRGKRLRWFLLSASVSFIALSTFAIWRSTSVWGSTILHAELTLLEHPRSLRATQFSAQQWLHAGRVDISRHLLHELADQSFGNTSLHLQVLYLDCLTGQNIPPSSIDTLVGQLRDGLPGNFVNETLSKILKLQSQGKCLELQLEDIDRLVSTLSSNPAVINSREFPRLALLQANIRILQRDHIGALVSALKGYQLSPSADKALLLATIYHTLGDWENVEFFVREAERLGRHRWLRINVFEPDIERWKTILQRRHASDHK